MAKGVQLIRKNPESIIIYPLLILLTIYLAVEAFFSLQWRMMHDAPLIIYPVFLLDKYGEAPYRDVFTNTFPGTLLFQLGIAKLFGYSDIAFRAVDLAWLGLISATSWGIMRRFGKRVAWAALVLFGVAYLNAGQVLSFQRDYIGMLPVALAVWAALSSRLPFSLQAFFVGLLFGLATSIKPQLGLGLPVVALFLVWEAVARRGKEALAGAFLRTVVFSALGLALPLMLVFAWVWRLGAWPAYREMVSVYLPLYLGMTGDHVTISGLKRWLYLARSYGQLGGLGLWLLPAGVGLHHLFFQTDFPPARRRQALLLAALAFIYSVYVVLGGKFWNYHWIPFWVFILLLSALTLAPVPAHMTRAGQRLFPALTLALAVILSFPPTTDFAAQAFGGQPRQPNDGRVDEIAAYLREHLKPGDTVQQLDWTGGATQAMLIAGARMATPYMEDYVFYHHVSHPYIQAQRQRFIAEMQKKLPRFIIYVSDTPRPRGKDASTDFPELQEILDKDYVVVSSGDGYKIYERFRCDCEVSPS